MNRKINAHLRSWGSEKNSMAAAPTLTPANAAKAWPVDTFGKRGRAHIDGGGKLCYNTILINVCSGEVKTWAQKKRRCGGR